MFDQKKGIAVFSAYTLTPDNVNFQFRNPSKWTESEGNLFTSIQKGVRISSKAFNLLGYASV